MNDDQAVRSASALVIGELGTALRQAVAHMRADDAMARRSADERTASHLTQIDRRLEEISTRLAPPSSSSAGTKSRRLDGFFLNRIAAVMVIAFIVALALAGAVGVKLVGDRAYENGRAVGFAQAAVFERDHPAQWRAYARSTVSLHSRAVAEAHIAR